MLQGKMDYVKYSPLVKLAGIENHAAFERSVSQIMKPGFGAMLDHVALDRKVDLGWKGLGSNLSSIIQKL